MNKVSISTYDLLQQNGYAYCSVCKEMKELQEATGKNTKVLICSKCHKIIVFTSYSKEVL